MEKIEILANNRVFHAHPCSGTVAELRLDSVYGGPSGRLPLDFFYVRLRQADGEMAWSSPIWLGRADD